MPQKIFCSPGHAVLVTGTSLTLLLSGCVGDMPHRGAWVAAPRNSRVQAAFSVPDLYYYYPDYAVYYNDTRRCYMYPESGIWLTSTVPANISTRDLLGARSVKMAFHDSPVLHHRQVSRDYPKTIRRKEPLSRPIKTTGTIGKALGHIAK